MDDTSLDSIKNHKPCPLSPLGFHEDRWYGVVAFSPCGEFVSHESDKPCNVTKDDVVLEDSSEEHFCTCRTELCSCGSFTSHRVSEPCNAKNNNN